MQGPSWEFFFSCLAATAIASGTLTWWLAEQFRKLRHARTDRQTVEALKPDVLRELIRKIDHLTTRMDNLERTLNGKH